MRERATVERGVITFDITDQPTEGYNKFIPYYLHPEATYNVGLSKSSFRTKVSVGTNPWTKVPVAEMANLAAICERYGGGGHARVGAISFPPDREDEARKAAGEIVAELRARNRGSGWTGMMWPVPVRRNLSLEGCSGPYDSIRMVFALSGGGLSFCFSLRGARRCEIAAYVE